MRMIIINSILSSSWAVKNFHFSLFFLSSSTALGNLGSVLSSQGRFDEAEEALLAALKFRRNMADAHYNLWVFFPPFHYFFLAVKNRYFWESLQSTRYASSTYMCLWRKIFHRKCIEYERFMMIKFLAWWKRRVWLQQQIHAIKWKLCFILKFYRSLERRLRFNPVEKGTIHHIQADLLLISFLPSDSFILFPVAAYYYMFNLPHTTCFTNGDVVKIVGAPISQHVLYNQVYTLTSSVLQSHSLSILENSFNRLWREITQQCRRECRFICDICEQLYKIRPQFSSHLFPSDWD